jgi:archaellum component FlaG (FlaF/FlaG flagellin family)
MDEGISLDEACAKNVIGTQEDFERSCNPDGTVKSQPETTTFTVKNDSANSVTVENAQLQIAIVGVVILAVVIAAVCIWKLKNKKSS